jgi:allantoinase
MIAHGMNNSTEILPLTSGLDAQKNYIRHTLDSVDSDVLSQLVSPSGPSILIPYPAITVDMGQFLTRSKSPEDIERMWIAYVTELTREADPDRGATIVAIGTHPFVVCTPDGAASLRRVPENMKSQKLGWVTDVEALLRAAGKKL